MNEHKNGIKEEIVWMLSRMGDYADLDLCDNIDEYADWLEEMATSELYDTYSIVSARYSRWSKKDKENESTRD